VIRDFDGGGTLDVVAVSQGQSGQYTVQVLLGNGNGTLGDATELLNASSGGGEHHLLLGDLDSLNGLDVVVGDQEGDTVAVWLQQADGTFVAGSSVNVGNHVVDLAIGDIDDDGDLDVVVAANASSGGGGGYYGYGSAPAPEDEEVVQLLLGNGDGTISDPTSHIVADPPIAVVVGDFDGDGDDDIASAGSPERGYYGSGEVSNSVSVLLSQGDGSLAPAVHYSLAHFVVDLQAGDIDGDGDTDLIATGDAQYNSFSPGRFAMSTLLGRGDGTFQTRIDTVLPDNPGVMVLGDVNGDGALDAAIINDNQQLMMLLGHGAMSVELLDASGDLIALGTSSIGPTNSRIADFLIDITGIYYARVNGAGGADFSLVVTDDAALDHQINDAQATAQDISPTGVVLGHLDTLGETSRGQSGAIRVAVHGLDTFVSIANQLDDDTFFDFDVYAVTGLDIDTLEELNQYDVVVLSSDFEFRNEGQLFGSALRQWVELGGGLVTTGNVWTFQNGEPAESDFDAVVPVDVAGFTDFTNRVDVTVLDSAHPITMGIPNFNTEDLESDSFFTVFEHDGDNNNTTLDDFPIEILQSPFPNLHVTSVTHNQIEIDLGDQFQVDWVVQNVGTAATSASFWRDRVYLSVDDQLDSTDIQIGESLNTSFLNAGESYGNGAIVTAFGVSAGEYYILVKTDARNPDQVEEFIAEGDNDTAGPKIIVVLPPPPDLMVLSAAAGLGVPPTGFSGQFTPINYHVANTGPGLRSAFSWFDDIYISGNEFFDNDDTFIGRVFRQHASSVDANNRVDYTVSTQARLPVGIQGDYFIFVLTDSTNRVNEFAFESNNFNSTGAPIHINLTPPHPTSRLILFLRPTPLMRALRLLLITPSPTVARRAHPIRFGATRFTCP